MESGEQMNDGISATFPIEVSKKAAGVVIDVDEGEKIAVEEETTRGSNIPDNSKKGKAKKHRGKSPSRQSKKGGTSAKGASKNLKCFP